MPCERESRSVAVELGSLEHRTVARADGGGACQPHFGQAGDVDAHIIEEYQTTGAAMHEGKIDCLPSVVGERDAARYIGGRVVIARMGVIAFVEQGVGKEGCGATSSSGGKHCKARGVAHKIEPEIERRIARSGHLHGGHHQPVSDVLVGVGEVLRHHAVVAGVAPIGIVLVVPDMHILVSGGTIASPAGRQAALEAFEVGESTGGRTPYHGDDARGGGRA